MGLFLTVAVIFGVLVADVDMPGARGVAQLVQGRTYFIQVDNLPDLVSKMGTFFF